LVTTVAPPILAVFSALLPAAGALEAVPPELVELDGLLQAAITKAAASPAGTSHTLFMTYRLAKADSRLLDLDYIAGRLNRRADDGRLIDHDPTFDRG
jgi:hypothetical protein